MPRPMMTADEIAAHNQDVADLWDAFSRRENRRVPITVAADEALWLSLIGRTFREFYTDPRVQLEAQLAGAEWLATHVVHDRAFGLPDTWNVAPRWWMDEPELLGCDVRIQENQFAWAVPLDDSKPDLLARLRDLDPKQAVLDGRLWRLYQDMLDLARDMTWRDRPVKVHMPGGGTHGLFTIACHVRGPEQLCLDLLDDPAFADDLLSLVGQKIVGRIKAWHELTGSGATFPSPDGWGMPDDSLQLLSAAAYRDHVLPVHQRIFAEMTTGLRRMHLCGHAQQHFPTLYHDLGLRVLDGPGPWVDYGRLLADLPELSLQAQADHTVLITGPVERVEEMMREMLTPAARQPGRLQVMGFMVPDTPLEHIQAMYEAAKRLTIEQP